MEPERELCDLGEILTTSVRLIETRASEKNIQVDLTIMPDCGTVFVDPRMLKQVVVNLLSNAVKFTRAGGKVEVLGEKEDGTMRITVSDAGIGIDSMNVERIFEPFYQIRAEKSETPGGTGLGLALSRQLVEVHGGSITLESEIGAGSTFTVSLPLRR